MGIEYHVSSGSNRAEVDSLYVGEIRDYAFNYVAPETKLGSTVEASIWTASDAKATITNTETASPTTSCRVTAVSEGIVLVKCAATMVDGQKVNKYLRLTIIE